MITLNNLINRVYNKDRVCTSFEMEIQYEENQEPVRIRFNKLNETDWSVFLIFKKTHIADSQVYSFDVQLNQTYAVKLDFVAAAALHELYMAIKEESMHKTSISIALHELVQGVTT